MCIVSLFSAKELEDRHRSGIKFKLPGVSQKKLQMLAQDGFVNYYSADMKISPISFQRIYGARLKGNVRKYKTII